MNRDHQIPPIPLTKLIDLAATITAAIAEARARQKQHAGNPYEPGVPITLNQAFVHTLFSTIAEIVKLPHAREDAELDERERRIGWSYYDDATRLLARHLDAHLRQGRWLELTIDHPFDIRTETLVRLMQREEQDAKAERKLDRILDRLDQPPRTTDHLDDLAQPEG